MNDVFIVRNHYMSEEYGVKNELLEKETEIILDTDEITFAQVNGRTIKDTPYPGEGRK